MKPRVAFLSCTALLLLPGTALADTLQQALEAAYKSNPTLTAQRANVRAADENVPIARAAGRPSLEGSAVYQENVLQGDQPPTLRSEEHTSELQSLMRISYAVFCLKKKKIYTQKL